MKITVINRSKWPTPAIDIIARWVARQAGVTWDYTINVGNTRRRGWYGHGWRNSQNSYVNRHYRRFALAASLWSQDRYDAEVKKARIALAGEIKYARKDEVARWDIDDALSARSVNECLESTQPIFRAMKRLEQVQAQKVGVTMPRKLTGNKPLWPYENKDHRFKWSDTQSFRSRLELLVFLLAHEACHATTGHPNHHRLGDGRADTAGMEFHCNAKGYRIMEMFRQEWPKLRSLIYAAMRRARRQHVTEIARKVAKRSDPGPKLALAEKRLKEWSRKKKLAETKIRKYRKQVRYYQKKASDPTRSISWGGQLEATTGQNRHLGERRVGALAARSAGPLDQQPLQRSTVETNRPRGDGSVGSTVDGFIGTGPDRP